MDIQRLVSSLFRDPQEVQALANMAHFIPGCVMFVVLVLLFLFCISQKKLFAYLYCTLLGGSFIALALYVGLHKGIEHLPDIFRIALYFPEIGVHLIQVLVTSVGCFFEIVSLQPRFKKYSFFSLVFPIQFILNGFVNILHPQGGLHSHSVIFIHAELGSFFIVAGVSLLLFRLIKEQYRKVFLFSTLIGLFGVGMILVRYKEPSYAYSYGFPKAAQTEEFAPFSQPAVVYINKERVFPQKIQLRVGSSITFIQLDDSVHDMASGPHPSHDQYPPLNIETLKQFEQKEVKFTKTGLFGFHDHLDDENPAFQGEIKVIE